ncbi:uncharacterized protein METZ01_LOCUS181575 [marine metagenome]|uniref:Uncharacterized protein n=1 Tax=marine metagenome TaxID=408172 RepID=A0A382CT32_9ZZZZ
MSESKPRRKLAAILAADVGFSFRKVYSCSGMLGMKHICPFLCLPLLSGVVNE